jgi:DNA-binding transcriptional ArsR family regulator
VIDTALRAIAEPRRREILRLIWDEELPAGQIAAHFDVTRAAVSQHLRVLREADLVSERRVGTSRLYRARPERISEVRAWLDSYWAQGLDSLKGAVEWDEKRRRRRGQTRTPRG